MFICQCLSFDNSTKNGYRKTNIGMKLKKTNERKSEKPKKIFTNMIKISIISVISNVRFLVREVTYCASPQNGHAFPASNVNIILNV